MKTLRPERLDTDLLELGDRRVVHPQKVGVSRYGMISSAHYLATQAGVEMLEEGGNAIDAAVAAAFALGVCEPAASGLGGQTMMMLHIADRHQTIALDGSSRAPNRASPDSYGARPPRRGHRASTVPSTPAVLRYALETFGTMKLARVLEPAIRLAEEGYAVSILQHALTRRELKHLKAGNAGEFYLTESGRPYPVGTTLRQPILAETLKKLARRGVKDFYTGQIARQIHEDMAANDGLIQKDDLAQIPRPIERRPLAGKFNGYRVFTFPPPGAGRTLVEMLNVYEQLPEKYRALDTPLGATTLAEVIRRAFLDRSDRPFDPNFYAQVPERKMLSEEYARLVAKQIKARIRTSGETTHLSVMDKYGNAVALTQSIELVYGASVACPELGFLYNNYMNAFEYKDMSHPYYLRPNAVPWASVAPTIVFRGRHPWLVIGSPGSERIAPSILQVLLRLATHTPFAAVDAPRLYCSLKGRVSLEATRMRNDIPAALTKCGYDVDVRGPHSFYLGCVQMVMKEHGEFIGVADPRRDGSASGPSK